MIVLVFIQASTVGLISLQVRAHFQVHLLMLLFFGMQDAIYSPQKGSVSCKKYLLNLPCSCMTSSINCPETVEGSEVSTPAPCCYPRTLNQVAQL